MRSVCLSALAEWGSQSSRRQELAAASSASCIDLERRHADWRYAPHSIPPPHHPHPSTLLCLSLSLSLSLSCSRPLLPTHLQTTLFPTLLSAPLRLYLLLRGSARPSVHSIRISSFPLFLMFLSSIIHFLVLVN